MSNADNIKAGTATVSASAARGRLVPAIEHVPEAGPALEKFLAFGGEGWLCATDSPDIRRFSHGARPAVAQGAFPLCGEAVNGQASLHLQKASSGWDLVCLRREAAEAEGQIILESRLLAGDGAGDLRYETAWQAADAAGLAESRPYAYRFAGFAPRSKEV